MAFSQKISSKVEEAIRAEGVRAYPNEGCGALFGRGEPDAREITDSMPIRNETDLTPRNRYLITSRDVMMAEKEAMRRGLSLVGFFHSHPDHPARPSQFDTDHAWPWLTYIIVSVRAGRALEMGGWNLVEQTRVFEPLDLISTAP